MSYSIVLAEDQGLILDSLKGFLSKEEDFYVIATACDGKEALARCRELKPDIALLDIRMPIMSGLGVAEALRQEGCLCKIVLLTTFEEEQVLAKALWLGVEGVFLKDIDPRLFSTSLSAIAQGLLVYDPVLKTQLAAKHTSDSEAAPFGLTERDILLIRFIIEGLGNKAIADRLNCAEGTVKNRVSSVLGKMGLEDRTQIAVYAIRNGLIKDMA